MKSTGNKILWLRWVLNCAFGELAGIGMAGAIAYFVNTAVGEPQTFYQKMGVLFAMLVAGAIEGSLLGYFQWRILREKFTRLPRKEWMLYTITVAVLGWLLGMLPSLFIFTGNNTSPELTSGPDFSNPWIFALMSISAGLILGGMFGLFQWFSLKKYSRYSYPWIIANAIGWAFGLGWIYLFASLPSATTTVVFNIFMGVTGGLLAGVSVGAVTGYVLIYQIKEDSTPQPSLNY